MQDRLLQTRNDFMPKLLYSSASPYSAKVRMAAAYAGIAVEAVPTKTDERPAQLVDANPLGKIPTLVLDDGRAIYDSRAITQYFNRESKNALFPRNADKRLEAEVLEALADGICDCAVSMVYERRARPEGMIYQPWLDKQWTKITAGLDMLNANPPKLPKKITAGQIALRACLGYLSLRFEGKWEKGRGRLTRWAARFDEKFPELKSSIPS
jgi:glutathione S-transferase